MISKAQTSSVVEWAIVLLLIAAAAASTPNPAF